VGCGRILGAGMRGGEGQECRWEGVQPGLFDPGPRFAARPQQQLQAGAAPHPRPPHPDETLAGSNITNAKRALLILLRAFSFARPHPVPRHTQTQRPIPLLASQMPKLLGAGAARRPAGPGWPGAPSLTLSRQLTFSVGYTTFPQRAHWGFIVAVPRGGGCAAAAGAPRSRCDIPRRAPHRLRAGGRAAGGRAPTAGLTDAREGGLTDTRRAAGTHGPGRCSEARPGGQGPRSGPGWNGEGSY